MASYKVVIEFDTLAQKGEITNQFVKDGLKALNLYHLVVIKELKKPKTKEIYGIEVKFEHPQKLTQAQIDAMLAMLRGMFAAWINPPLPDPPSRIDFPALNVSAGIAYTPVLPIQGDGGRVTYLGVNAVEPEDAAGEGSSMGVLWNLGAGNAFVQVPSAALEANLVLNVINNFHDVNDPLILPAGTNVTIKGTGGATLALHWATDIVVPNFSKSYWLDANGKLYFKNGPLYDPQLPRYTYAEAVANGAI